jgi:hypothetical protein
MVQTTDITKSLVPDFMRNLVKLLTIDKSDSPPNCKNEKIKEQIPLFELLYESEHVE